MDNSKKKLSLGQKQSLAGWAFLTPAVLFIAVMSFLPMIQALFLSFQSGK
ncbi:MAG: sugar ABC transporter permease, partial [Paenibacillaceae bacterium]|nr:sugar ABC transporter permease [Paenibacillaceae bacterium]